MVTEIVFEEARAKWAPLLVAMSQQFVPYLDKEDVRQELELVLLRCCRGYDGRVMFYTYLRRALENQVKKLISRHQRHNPWYGGLVYLSELDTWFDDSYDGVSEYQRIRLALSVQLEESSELFLTTCGFEELERCWLLGRAQGLYAGEIARLEGVSEREIKRAARSAKKKTRVLREVTECPA